MRERLAIESSSDYLVIYLKRYQEDLRKSLDPFEIHTSLDLSPFSVSRDNSKGQWNYNLIGTLHHDGPSLNTGHYFSLVRKEDGKWWKFNDTMVSPYRLALTEVRPVPIAIACWFGYPSVRSLFLNRIWLQKLIGGECVMLFYQRASIERSAERSGGLVEVPVSGSLMTEVKLFAPSLACWPHSLISLIVDAMFPPSSFLFCTHSACSFRRATPFLRCRLYTQGSWSNRWWPGRTIYGLRGWASVWCLKSY